MLLLLVASGPQGKLPGGGGLRSGRTCSRNPRDEWVSDFCSKWELPGGDGRRGPSQAIRHLQWMKTVCVATEALVGPGLKTWEGSMECPQEEARWEPRCRPLRAVSFQDVRIIPFPVHDVGSQPRLMGPDGECPNMIL